MKRLMALIALCLVMAACAPDTDEETIPTAEGIQNMNEDNNNVPEEQHDDGRFFLDDTIFEQLRGTQSSILQLRPVEAGEELVVMHTNFGDITLRFFPEEAPMAVENFLTHARDGYYDGLLFHRVVEDFMLQGGCPQGTGRGGESIWGHGFGLERSFNLFHFRGALATAHAGPGTIGSQFYIVQNSGLHTSYVNLFRSYIAMQDDVAGEFSDGTHILIRDIFPPEAMEHFMENGGTPHLDWHWNEQNYGHTVFGHVVDGMDVVDAIAAVEVSLDRATMHRPYEDVIINGFSFIIHK